MLYVITPGLIYFLNTFDYLFPFSPTPVLWKVGFFFFFPGIFLGPFCFSLPERAAKDVTLSGVFCGTLVPLGRAGGLAVFYTSLPARAWVTELAVSNTESLATLCNLSGSCFTFFQMEEFCRVGCWINEVTSRNPWSCDWHLVTKRVRAGPSVPCLAWVSSLLRPRGSEFYSVVFMALPLRG